MADPVSTSLASGESATATTTVSGWACTAGDLLTLHVSSDDYRTTAGGSRPEGNGWTLNPNLDNGTPSAFHGSYFWFKIADGTETSVAYTIGSASKSAYVLEKHTNIDPTNPFVIAAKQEVNSSGGTYTTPSSGTTAAGRMYGIAHMTASSGSQTLAINGGWLNSYTQVGTAVTSAAPGEAIGVATLAFDGSAATSSGCSFGANTPTARTGMIAVFRVKASAAATPLPKFFAPRRAPSRWRFQVQQGSGARTPVTPLTIGTSWNVRAAVSPKTTATTWNTRAQVAKTTATTWNTRAAVSPKTTATTWNTRAAVSPKTTATTWNVRAAIAKTVATTWNVRAAVAKTVATTWNTRAAVSPKTGATTWNTHAVVTAKTVATTWNTRASVSPKTTATTWNVRAQVGKTTSTTWNTRALVSPKTVATSWNVRSVVTALTVATSWNTRAQVSLTVITTWNVYSLTPAGGWPQPAKWFAPLRAPTRIRYLPRQGLPGLAPVTPLTVGTSWNVRAQVSKTTATSWNTHAVVTAKTVATSWNVRASVSPKTTVTSWNVRAAVVRSVATSWNVHTIVTAKTSSTTWRVRAVVGAKTIVTTWNVRATVTRTVATTWNVQALAPVVGPPGTITTTVDVTARITVGYGDPITSTYEPATRMEVAE